MKYLFLDNFRGFSNTSIPLVDVNFLVGENSAGKTSLLTMLRMFSGPQLFMGPEDMSIAQVIPFGHFSEMVSVHSSDQSYFRVGYVDEFTNRKNMPTEGSAILLTYKNIDGLSQISRLTCTMPNGEAHLAFEDQKIFYKSETPTKTKNAAEMHERLLDWAKEHNVDRDKEWKEISNISNESRRIPLVMILAIATSSEKQNNKKRQQLSFAFPRTAPTLIWIAPIRSEPRRTYDEPQMTYSSQGSHIPYVIRRMLSSNAEAKKFKGFIERIGEASGLFQRIEIKHFGVSETSPFEVDAYLDDTALSVGWLGYGVSQSLPIFVELLDRPRGSWFAIQQPEVHLHPRAQACLGDVFFEMAMRDDKKFLIETHSDFAIDRFRMNYKKRRSKKAKVPQSQVLFFERKNRQNTVTALPIGPQGEMPSNQPEGYRRFFIKEEMQMLGLE